MRDIFVYGTLQFPEVIEKLTGKTFTSHPAILPGYKRCRITGCDYPAIIEQRDSKVKGILITGIDDESLGVLTFFEGEDYASRQVSVLFNQRMIKAETFIWTGDPSLLNKKKWEASMFKKYSLSFYIDEVIPQTVQEYLLFKKGQ